MSLETKIVEDIKDAMRSKEKERLEALRAVKSALILAKTEKDAGEMTEEGEVKILQKLVKQRTESAKIYREQGRDDLADKEEKEVSFIKVYLPEQMSAEEVEKVISKLAADNNITQQSDFGKLMGLAMKELTGKTDGKMISAAAKKVLE
ncbi:MAG: GatB/YqeY domain-containing protein [Bacteroidales bacterium]|nr:GatB/YqeY domain-containing protein [Bacteroidales bacterium]